MHSGEEANLRRKSILVAVVAAFLLAGAGALALDLWLDLEGVALGIHGWLALSLGVALSLVIGVGLMALVFVSARRGYDDIGGSSDPGRQGPPGWEAERAPPEPGDKAQR